MAQNFSVIKEKQRRVYTFTKTKSVIAFILSVLFSVLLSSYFDRYGSALFEQGSAVLFGEEETETQGASRNPNAGNSSSQRLKALENESLRRQVGQLKTK